jgi:hypothetical protein
VRRAKLALMLLKYTPLCLLLIACPGPKSGGTGGDTGPRDGFDPTSIASLAMKVETAGRLNREVCEGAVVTVAFTASDAAGAPISSQRLNTAQTPSLDSLEGWSDNTIEIKTTPPTYEPISCFDGACSFRAPAFEEEFVIEARIRGTNVAGEPHRYELGSDCVVRGQVLAINRSGGSGNTGENGIVSTDNGGTGEAGHDAPKPQRATVEAAWVIAGTRGRTLLVVADRMFDDEDKENVILVKPGAPATVSGNGGTGGKGGDGGNGVRMKGECTPGRGGYGGNGGDGGDGSALVVRAPSQDVLDALVITVEGGKGGKAGEGGRGGTCEDVRGDKGLSGNEGKDGAPGTIETKIVPAAKLSLIQAYLAKHPDTKLAK